MLVYAVRHAESLANVDAGAGLNSSLSPLGVEQAARLARRFRDVPWAAIYSSPLRRCLETVRPIAEAAGAGVRIRPDLWEYHRLPAGTEARLDIDPPDRFLRADGLLEACPDLVEGWDWPVLDEGFEAMLGRVQRFAAYLKARWTRPDDVVLVMSHGSPVARLIEAWLTDQPGPAFRFVIDNAAVTALRHANAVSSLVCLNEVSHLAGLAAPRQANYRADGTIKAEPPATYW